MSKPACPVCGAGLHPAYSSGTVWKCGRVDIPNDHYKECPNAEAEVRRLRAQLAGVMEAIDAETELPGECPEGLYRDATSDRDTFTFYSRELVRETKKGIKARIERLGEEA